MMSLSLVEIPAYKTCISYNYLQLLYKEDREFYLSRINWSSEPVDK